MAQTEFDVEFSQLGKLTQNGKINEKSFIDIISPGLLPGDSDFSESEQ